MKKTTIIPTLLLIVIGLSTIYADIDIPRLEKYAARGEIAITALLISENAYNKSVELIYAMIQEDMNRSKSSCDWLKYGYELSKLYGYTAIDKLLELVMGVHDCADYHGINVEDVQLRNILNYIAIHAVYTDAYWDNPEITEPVMALLKAFENQLILDDVLCHAVTLKKKNALNAAIDHGANINADTCKIPYVTSRYYF
jgi:hypothetical protein